MKSLAEEIQGGKGTRWKRARIFQQEDREGSIGEGGLKFGHYIQLKKKEINNLLINYTINANNQIVHVIDVIRDVQFSNVSNKGSRNIFFFFF